MSVSAPASVGGSFMAWVGNVRICKLNAADLSLGLELTS